MTTMTVPLDDELYDKIHKLSWVRWSKVAQDGIRKRKIFETYMRDKEISEDDAVFCEMIDWHPVDELPLKEEFIDKIKKIAKEPGIPVKDISDIFR
ncbi:hypothetical protein SAMN04488589_0066 [Methanolobus vulcani]|jgi:hypothetical protein|uniref:Uncharacterized protein n=1 Tax=Methanolobus vulcani TaxID=38026 RepID=A0A7Z7AZE4_9EURY|nr:hypothetical protein [Methanolobus vulcani]MDK2947848.1 hypothetical protein [Methanolobus sp.]SDF23365.1 hypothetical protein SAMN04488589_0066 [Methanolobus vulcani]